MSRCRRRRWRERRCRSRRRHGYLYRAVIGLPCQFVAFRIGVLGRHTGPEADHRCHTPTCRIERHPQPYLHDHAVLHRNQGVHEVGKEEVDLPLPARRHRGHGPPVHAIRKHQTDRVGEAVQVVVRRIEAQARRIVVQRERHSRYRRAVRIEGDGHRDRLRRVRPHVVRDGERRTGRRRCRCRRGRVSWCWRWRERRSRRGRVSWCWSRRRGERRCRCWRRRRSRCGN